MTQTVQQAVRHRCASSLGSVHCTRGNGRPTRQTCRHCRGILLIEKGLWGVFVWRGDGRYRLEDAISTATREAVAERRCTEENQHVVRWIPA